MHFARIHRHATVLGIQTPDNLAESVFEALNDLELPSEENDSADQAAFLVRVGVRSNGEHYVEPTVIRTWPTLTRKAAWSALSFSSLGSSRSFRASKTLSAKLSGVCIPRTVAWR
jgi:hypothetical protein